MKPFDRSLLIAYEFLFVFHCNYGRILYRFRNTEIHWSKNANFSYPLVFNLHPKF